MSSLEGVAELERKLRKLGALEDGKVMRRVTRLAIRPAYDAARAAVPVYKPTPGYPLYRLRNGAKVGAGFAASQLVINTKLLAANTRADATIKAKRFAYFITRWVERGSKYQPAKRWLQRSFRASKDAMLESVRENLKAEVERIAKEG